MRARRAFRVYYWYLGAEISSPHVLTSVSTEEKAIAAGKEALRKRRSDGQATLPEESSRVPESRRSNCEERASGD